MCSRDAARISENFFVKKKFEKNWFHKGLEGDISRWNWVVSNGGYHFSVGVKAISGGGGGGIVALPQHIRLLRFEVNAFDMFTLARISLNFISFLFSVSVDFIALCAELFV